MRGVQSKWDMLGTDVNRNHVHLVAVDNGYDPTLQDDVLLLLTAVIADLQIVAD